MGGVLAGFPQQQRLVAVHHRLPGAGLLGGRGGLVFMLLGLVTGHASIVVRQALAGAQERWQKKVSGHP
ncbi:hypothetical protein D7Z96_19935 [Pseudarthrobacter phenanthrenivorans]|uniref:Uncharacterized protein n=1 Tax=Pseudarthrobacter phenanthrenivorans TaxID=361575 RepID=A0A3B0FJA9_PSEPS|nr:hypothetical protein D7Z96_19935 [Pseudarthrobacter phenanthrenivorans]